MNITSVGFIPSETSINNIASNTATFKDGTIALTREGTFIYNINKKDINDGVVLYGWSPISSNNTNVADNVVLNSYNLSDGTTLSNVSVQEAMELQETKTIFGGTF